MVMGWRTRGRRNEKHVYSENSQEKGKGENSGIIVKATTRELSLPTISLAL